MSYGLIVSSVQSSICLHKNKFFYLFSKDAKNVTAMKKILILGAGTAGTIMANKLRKALNANEWRITIVDSDKRHFYQPGFLFIPFGTYSAKEVVKPKNNFIPKGVELIYDEILQVFPDENKVQLASGVQSYDYLIIATGTRLAPEETPGVLGDLWEKDIFEFYTYEGSLALHERFKNWQGGKLVLSIVDMPIKCPVAPIEFVCLADAYFTKRGIRDKVDIALVTPLPGAFTKPIATAMLGEMLAQKNINVITDFYIERVDNESKKLVSYDEKEVPFDILTIVPLNKGADFIGKSGLGDELNFVPVNKHTLRSEKYANMFVLGDASNIPASKAGSVAHFAADVLFENMLAVMNGKEPVAQFDGHSNCYIETGFGKGALIDFNYTTEPLTGTFPIPKLGPFKLLRSTRMNHWGKLFFRWIYWYILLPGRHLPVSSAMSMAGKNVKQS
jgi:sulfide:quinone oxidoreductase